MPLHGELVTLREERIEDMPLLVKLRNDLDTQAWSKTLPPDYTLNMYNQRFAERGFSFDRDDGRFIIEHRESGKFAGYIGYSGLQPRWEVSIGVMVDKQYWGTGVAQDAHEVLLHFLFQELGVRVVRLWTHTGNVRMVGLAEKLGFSIALRQREAIYKSGLLLDNIVMDMIREEYFTRHPELEDHLPPLV